MRLFHLAFILLFVAFASPVLAASGKLIVVERDDCHWCDVWQREVGRTYNSTPVGRIAPLRRVDLYAAKPRDLSHINLGRFTPTFILLDTAGNEVARMRGYAGKENFWLILKDQLKYLPGLRSRSRLKKTQH